MSSSSPTALMAYGIRRIMFLFTILPNVILQKVGQIIDSAESDAKIPFATAGVKRNSEE